MISFWFQNGMGAKHMLVDLGYVNDESSRNRADQLLPMAGRKNVQIVGQGRLTMHLPPKKRDAVLRAFPLIREGGAEYCWCSHSWLTDEPLRPVKKTVEMC